jgi:hypothetical protein
MSPGQSLYIILFMMYENFAEWLRLPGSQMAVGSFKVLVVFKFNNTYYIRDKLLALVEKKRSMIFCATVVCYDFLVFL